MQNPATEKSPTPVIFIDIINFFTKFIQPSDSVVESLSICAGSSGVQGIANPRNVILPLFFLKQQSQAKIVLYSLGIREGDIAYILRKFQEECQRLNIINVLKDALIVLSDAIGDKIDLGLRTKWIAGMSMNVLAVNVERKSYDELVNRSLSDEVRQAVSKYSVNLWGQEMSSSLQYTLSDHLDLIDGERIKDMQTALGVKNTELVDLDESGSVKKKFGVVPYHFKVQLQKLLELIPTEAIKAQPSLLGSPSFGDKGNLTISESIKLALEYGDTVSFCYALLDCISFIQKNTQYNSALLCRKLYTLWWLFEREYHDVVQQCISCMQLYDIAQPGEITQNITQVSATSRQSFSAEDFQQINPESGVFIFAFDHGATMFSLVLRDNDPYSAEHMHYHNPDPRLRSKDDDIFFTYRGKQLLPTLKLLGDLGCLITTHSHNGEVAQSSALRKQRNRCKEEDVACPTTFIIDSTPRFNIPSRMHLIRVADTRVICCPTMITNSRDGIREAQRNFFENVKIPIASLVAFDDAWLGKGDQPTFNRDEDYFTDVDNVRYAWICEEDYFCDAVIKEYLKIIDILVQRQINYSQECKKVEASLMVDSIINKYPGKIYPLGSMQLIDKIEALNKFLPSLKDVKQIEDKYTGFLLEYIQAAAEFKDYINIGVSIAIADNIASHCAILDNIPSDSGSVQFFKGEPDRQIHQQLQEAQEVLREAKQAYEREFSDSNIYEDCIKIANNLVPPPQIQIAGQSFQS